MSAPSRSANAAESALATENMTRKIAHLARLKLTEAEVQLYTTQLKKILGYVEQLQAVKTTRPDGSPVPPLIHPLEQAAAAGTSLVLERADQAQSFDPTMKDGVGKITGHAPDVLHGGFKVPQIVGGA